MMEILLWVGFSQSLFAAILIGAKKKASVSDKILTAWLSLLAIEFLTCIFDYSLFGTPLLSSSFLLFNPAFYLYIKSLTDKNFFIKPTQLVHLLPFVLFEILAYVFQETISLNTYFDTDPTLGFRFAFGFANVFSWVAYNYLSFKELYKHRKNLKNEFSNFQNQKTLGWAFYIFLFYNLYCISSIIIGISVIVIAEKLLLPHIYNYATLLFLIYLLGFYGLKQTDIFIRKKSLSDDSPDEKYKNSLLTNKQKLDIKNRILDYFESETPYLNQDLSMDILADSLKIPKHHVSEVLSTELGNNFFTFVNTYRIEAVKTMLDDPKNKWSVEAIGYECGFNSKSSFFTVFKKSTGMTPYQYKTKLD